METALVLKFVRHLQSCTETVMQKVEIDRYDVDALRRELLQMQRHIDGQEQVNPVILDGILGLELKIDEALLGGSTQSKWLFVLSSLFRNPLLHSQRNARQEKLKFQIKAFQEDLDHLRFALDR